MIRRTFKLLFSFSKRTRMVDYLPSSSDDDILDPDFVLGIEQGLKLEARQLSEEDLTAVISSYVSPQSLLDAYEVHKDSVTVSHSLLVIRIMSRYPDLLRAFIGNPQFTQRIEHLVNDINQKIRSMNEIDLIDILFWVRKLTRGGVYSLGPKFLNMGKLHNRIAYHLEKGEYSLRYVVNVYFDYTFLNRSTDKVAKEALRLMGETKQIQEINFISALTMSKACIQKQMLRRSVDVELMKVFLDFADQILDESDLIQQSAYLVDASRLRIYLYDSNFRFPKVVIRIAENIKNNIDRLQEITVLSTFEAYVFFPSHFQSELLDSIWTILMKTIDLKPNQIRTEFCYRILLPTLNISKDLVNQECLNKLTNHLVEQLLVEKDFFSREYRFYILIKIINTLNIKLEKKHQHIFQELGKSNEYFNVPCLFILHSQFNQNIKNELEEIQSLLINQNKKREIHELFIIGSLFEDYNIELQYLQSIFFPLIDTLPLKLLHYAYNLNKPNSPYLTSVLLQISRAFQDSLTQLRSQKIDHLRFVPRLIQNSVLSDHWIKWTKQKREFLLIENNYESFFPCLVYSTDYRENQLEQVQFFNFLFYTFEREIKPSLIWMFMRHQPRMLKNVLEYDKNLLQIFYRKLSFYKHGEEIARLLFILEMSGLSYLIEARDILAQFHYAFSNSKKVSNQLVYYMVKYSCLQSDHIYLIYNNLLDPKDCDLKQLLIMIQYFFNTDRNIKFDNEIHGILIQLTNQVCSKYQQP